MPGQPMQRSQVPGPPRRDVASCTSFDAQSRYASIDKETKPMVRPARRRLPSQFFVPVVPVSAQGSACRALSKPAQRRFAAAQRSHAPMLHCSERAAAPDYRSGGSITETDQMSELSELGRVLHEEHFRILVAISDLKNRVSGAAAERPLDPALEEDRAWLRDLIGWLKEIGDHHAFEEAVLFPLLCRGGACDLATLFADEHDTIGPITRRLHRLARELLQSGAGTERWAAFRAVAERLATEMMHHLQKEEATVVQRLDVLLDAVTDHDLAVSLVAARARERGPDACAGRRGQARAAHGA
jgi:hemerythrin-like domain-containing protein